MVAAFLATCSYLRPFHLWKVWKIFGFQEFVFPTAGGGAGAEEGTAYVCSNFVDNNSRKGNTNECDDQNRRSSRLNATWEALPGRARERAAARNYKKMPRRLTRRPARSGEWKSTSSGACALLTSNTEQTPRWIHCQGAKDKTSGGPGFKRGHAQGPVVFQKIHGGDQPHKEAAS